MKILCLTPWFPSHREDPFGSYILDSIEALSDLGHEIVTLISSPWKPKLTDLISKFQKRNNLSLHEFSNNFILNKCNYFSIPRNYIRSFSNFSYRKTVGSSLQALIRKHNCQLIHAHTELAGVAAIDIGKKLNIPTILTMHGINTDPKLYKGTNRKLLFEYTISQANRVVLVGEPLISFCKDFVSTDNHFRVIYNGFRLPPKEFMLERTNWPQQLRFISVSNLHEGKGIDLNLQALAQLKKKGYTQWNYKIVGDGYLQKNLKSLVDALDLRENVAFLGSLNHNEVYAQLANSDIFILPSYREAFGIAYIEAMACGLLAVGVQLQGPQAFIKHEKTGLLVPPKDIESLEKTFANIFNSQNKMLQIAKSGKDYVHNHLTWYHHAVNLTKVYQELLP